MEEKLTEEQREEILKIAERASKIYESVNQKYDDKPYGYHLGFVATIMKTYVDEFNPGYELYKILFFASVFHDSIENARLTYNDVLKIAKEYMSPEDAIQATEIVYALTNDKGRTRQERAGENYYNGIRETLYAPFIKACDRYSNIWYSKEKGSRMYDVYKKEMPEFLDHIQVDSNPVPPELLKALQEI